MYSSLIKNNKANFLNIDVDGLGFHDINFYFNNNKQLIIAGLTTETKVKNNHYLFDKGSIGGAITYGAFAITLNSEGNQIQKKSIRNFNNGKYLNYSIENINEFEDGSIGFVCTKILRFEHMYKNKHNILKPSTFKLAEGVRVVETIYKYKNILTFNLNTTESDYWIKTFEIDQESKEDGNRGLFESYEAKEYLKTWTAMIANELYKDKPMGNGSSKENDGYYIHSVKSINTPKNLNIFVNNKAKNEVVIKENENIELGSLKEQDAATRFITINPKGKIEIDNLTSKFGVISPVLLTNSKMIEVNKNKFISLFISNFGDGVLKLGTILIK